MPSAKHAAAPNSRSCCSTSLLDFFQSGFPCPLVHVPSCCLSPVPPSLMTAIPSGLTSPRSIATQHIPLVFRSSQTSLVFVVLHLFVSLGLSILSPSLHENVSPPEANGFVCFPAPARTREGASDAF